MKLKKHLKFGLLSCAVALCMQVADMPLHGQGLVRGIETRFIPLFDGDSVKVEILYADRERAPFIVILPDRYGVQISTRQIMRSFADAGFHTAALHLLTRAPVSRDDTATTLNDADPGRIIEAVVELRNDPRGRGKIGLLAFDVGATSGLMAEARIPLFAVCALFYPSDRELFLDALQKSTIPVDVNMSRQDTLFPESEMLELKMRFMSKTNPIVFRYYDAGRYFFNPGHPRFDTQAMQRGVNHTATLLRQHLR